MEKFLNSKGDEKGGSEKAETPILVVTPTPTPEKVNGTVEKSPIVKPATEIKLVEVGVMPEGATRPLQKNEVFGTSGKGSGVLFSVFDLPKFTPLGTQYTVGNTVYTMLYYTK